MTMTSHLHHQSLRLMVRKHHTTPHHAHNLFLDQAEWNLDDLDDIPIEKLFGTKYKRMVFTLKHIKLSLKLNSSWLVSTSAWSHNSSSLLTWRHWERKRRSWGWRRSRNWRWRRWGRRGGTIWPQWGAGRDSRKWWTIFRWLNEVSLRSWINI